MKTNRKYAVAVAFLVVLAVAFGVFGTVAPPLAEESTPIQTQQESSSESVGHFQNPPTYDSGWLDITTKAGQYVTLKHDLNTTNVVVDITGKQSLEASGGVVAWLSAYGGTLSDLAHSVVETDDGGYALAGITNSFGAGSWDFWLVKTDSSGMVQWNRTYGGIGADYARSVVETADGGYALAGYTYSFGAGGYDMWLVKTDASGTLQWNITIGGTSSDYAYSVVESGNGGYALAGYTNSFGVGGNDFWLVKTDAAGVAQWNRTYGGASYDYAYSVVESGNGGYALAGYTGSYGAGGNDMWLVKTDSAGNALWNQTYGGANADRAYSVVESGDGGYALAGYTNSFGAGGSDFWLVKTDSAGTTLWNKTYGGTGADYGYSLVRTTDGGFTQAGYTYSFGASGYDFWLVKTDSAGNALWNQTYGGAYDDHAYSVAGTSDGGYALAGSTYSFGVGGNDFWLVKVKPELGLEHQRNLGGIGIIPCWKQTYGGAGGDSAHSVIQTSDGGYALAGITSFGVGGGDFWLVKTDASGNVQWSRTYGGTDYDTARSVIQTGDGGYALTGFTESYGAGLHDLWLVKTDAAGVAQWNRTYGGADYDAGYSVVETSDGGYALAGYTGSFGLSAQMYLVKTDKVGNQLWAKTYGGTYKDYCKSVVQTGDGGYALAGYTFSYGVGTPTYYNIWLIKTDSAGNALWNQTYGGTDHDVAESVVQTADGGYALAGYTDSYGSGRQAYLVRTDALGITVWNQTYGGADYEYAYSVVECDDGGYALAGSTNSSGAGSDDSWLVRTDSAGNILWSRTYGGTSRDVVYSVVETSGGGYALAGYTYSYGSGTDDFWLVKSDVEIGLTKTGSTNNSITLYRGKTDLDWNYVRVRIWLIEEPSWIYGDINMDGIVDAKDLYILGRNYGKAFSLLSLGGIVAVAGIRTVKKRKQSKQPSYIN